MALTSQSTPDSSSLSSPGYHEFQSYSHETFRNLRSQYPVSQAIPVNRPHFTTMQFNDIYEPSRSYWNGYDRQQGRIESSVYPHSLTAYPPASNGLIPRPTHQQEQTTTTSSLPPVPAAENLSDNYFYSSYEDRAAGASLQNIYLLTNRSSEAGSPTTVPYS